MIISEAVTNYLDAKINEFIIIFSLFIVFLVACLIIALKYIIKILEKAVFRSRILVKIIPTDELRRLHIKSRRMKY